MSKNLLIAAIALLAASCSNQSEETVINEGKSAPVYVHVNDFVISLEEGSGTQPMSRAAENPATYSGVGAMTLAFYDEEGTEVYKTTQVKSNESTYTVFGDFTANLKIGHYTMVALGYGYFDGDVFTLTSPTQAAFTSERPRETFSNVQSVTVTSASPLDLDVTLNRINAKLSIQSTDGRSASAKKIRTTFAKGSKSFNPTSGFSLTDAGFTQVNNPSSAVGTTISVSIYPFLYTDEEEMDITIEALDADDNVLFTKLVEDVPFKRNYITTLRGAIYTAAPSAAAFQVETAWETGETVNF